ncbi:MAG TPA: hypothetical protein VGG48_18845 [Rhizomicrobium sp.]|jgi:hypothetical protein
MHKEQSKPFSLTCGCGKVSFHAAGSPIVTAACYCADCRNAGGFFERLLSAPSLLDANGGTPIVLYRKDRVMCVAGLEYLAAYRLSPDSPTRRVLATCCNTALFLDFTKGHWLSLYRSRLSPNAPPLEMRVMTKDRRAGIVLPNDVPNYEGYPGKFMLKLIAAWIAMGFRRPDMGLNDIPRSTFAPVDGARSA